MKLKSIFLIPVLGIANLSAQVVLNSDFEGNNLDNWLVTSTDSNGFNSNTLSNGFNVATITYPDGAVADLGGFIAFGNVISGNRPNVTFVTDVYENDETTPQLISADEQLTFTVALGDRSNSDNSNFGGAPDTTLTVGYLTTAGDLNTFVGLSSTTIPAATINANIENQFNDFSVSFQVVAGNAAIGNQFAVQLSFDVDGTIRRQGVFDRVRVDVGSTVSDINSFAASPNEILGSEDVNLTWSTFGFGRLEITDDQGSSPIVYTATTDSQAFLDSGSVSIPSVSTDTVFTLSATLAEDGTGTPVTEQAEVIILQSAPDVTLVAVPSVASGTSDVTLFFNATVVETPGAEVVSGTIEGFGTFNGLAANQVEDDDVDFTTILTGPGPYIFEVTNGGIVGMQYEITSFSGGLLTVDGTPADDDAGWTNYRIIEPSTFRGADSLTISDGSSTVFSTTDSAVIASGSTTVLGVSANTTFTATATFPGGGSTPASATFSIGNGTSYEELVLTQSPIGFYRFEEHLNSATIYDSSGNEAHSIAIANPEFLTTGSAGILGNGGIFDEPAATGASVVTGVNLDPSSSSWTISALVQPDGFDAGDAHIVSNRDGGGTGRSMLFIDTGTSILQSFAGATNTPDINDSVVLEATPSYLDNAVCHVALTYDLAATTLSVYRDGTLVGQRTDITPEFAAGSWVIGAHKSNNGNLFWDGIIDEVAFFDTALGAGDIAAQNNAFLAETTLGILAFGSDATINAGESVDLFAKVGGNATSATIDNGVGPVIIGGSDTYSVAPTTTTTYTLNVDGDEQNVTVTVEAPATITITGCGFDGSGNFFIDVAEGVTGFVVTSSPELETAFAPVTGVTDDGSNRFTIPVTSVTGKDFFRVEAL